MWVVILCPVCLGVSVDRPCDSSNDCGDNMGCAAGPKGDQSCFCLTGHVARQDQSCGVLDVFKFESTTLFQSSERTCFSVVV